MIVNSTPAGWQIIYQQAHALLAAQLAWLWPPTLAPDRWVGLLAAAAQHDDEQEEWYKRGGHHGLTPAGAPANFTQKEFSMAQARGVMAAARYQGQWRSLLTSMHLSCLYESLRGSTPAITGFLDELRAGQQQWRRALKVKKEEAQSAYDLLHWTDRLSLILCRGELPEMGRSLEISRGPDGQRYDVRQPHPGGPIHIEPWPFVLDEAEVTVEASVLTQLQYSDDAELAAALREAPIETLRWTLRRA
ncbi:DUF3891 family protein [Hymenobacter sp. BT770]|uniref:DUF3891 family protein n=1 Tax=Hymenobacter sp. BT770 TaxID=2886942 RepID=UPI001D129DF3|nr:DUF3891 family protein [Hymenobacter sp. BT770]MCC3151891.1 DUF3891 family protein [Hymenobacter sp. BT770]MDO3413487.1 DUF3891 family protein [Hymenobacter sp. BT770]